MNTLGFATCVVILLVSSMPGPLRAQQFEYNKQAEFDADGNIYVSSDQGKLIRMADLKHCSEAHVANDQQTVGCRVMQNQELGNTVPSFRLEIYRKGGYKGIIEPGEPVLEWHFWRDGQQVAVSSGLGDGPTTYALYDSATSRIIEKLPTPPDEALLPQWAKSAAQIQDESVPITPELSQQRTQWIGKLLRQISKIKPGMSRRDLLEVFTVEGGISTRTQRTYVLKECHYIKITVHFKTIGESSTLDESPGDIVESISQPFLAGSVVD